MKKPIVHVTDHAVLQYLERVLLVDVEGLRKRIGRNVDLAVKHGASGSVTGGFRYRLKGKSVITILPKCHNNKRTGRGKP